MIKKIVLALVLLVVVCGVLYFVFGSQKAVIRNELSERGKEYLENRDDNEESSLQYLSLDGASEVESAAGSIAVGDCFTIRVPFRVNNSRQKDTECHLYLSTTTPKGTIITYMQNSEIGAFDEVPGVSFRRKSPEKYSEEEIDVNGKRFLVFTRTDTGGFVRNVFYYMPTSYLVVNFDLSTGEDMSEEMLEVLGSIELQ